jgi:hypothetical protein
MKLISESNQLKFLTNAKYFKKRQGILDVVFLLCAKLSALSQVNIAKMRLLASPSLSVSPSVYPHVKTHEPLNRFSLNLTSGVLLTFVDTSQFLLKSDNNNGHFQ